MALESTVDVGLESIIGTNAVDRNTETELGLHMWVRTHASVFLLCPFGGYYYLDDYAERFKC